MTATTHKPSITSRAIFQRHSLKTKLTLFTMTFFLLGIWSLAFYASQLLRRDMQSVLSEQQFSTVSIMADNVNQELSIRLQSVEMIAAKITPATLHNRTSLQRFLEDRYNLQLLFNGGAYITGPDGTAIADVPISTGRIGMNSSDRGWMIEALKGKTTVGKPVIGKKLQVPVFSMATPIRDMKGNVIGVLVGVVDLSKPNFLEGITNTRYGKTGAYLLIAPQHRLFITGTDKTRIMQTVPATGINPLFDRYVQGFEGSGVVTDSRGLEVMSSAKQIPAAGWLLVARIPTTEAFAPIRNMMRSILLVTTLLSLLAACMVWWLLKRQLAPVFTTIKTLATLSDTEQPLQPLPITRQDEIGELISAFNKLLIALGKREVDLKESAGKFRDLYDSAPVGYHEYNTEGRITNVNTTTSEMLGYSREEMIRQYVWHFSVEEDITRQQVLEKLTGLRPPGRAIERTYRRKNGSIFQVLIENRLLKDEQGRIIGIRSATQDITDRKRDEEEKRSLQERLQRAEKMESLGLLAGGVAHDLNNVLGIVVGYAELTLESVDASNSIKPYLVNIMNGGQKAAAIVNDLLTLARRGVSGKEVLNLNEIIAECQQSPEFEKLSSYHPAVKISTDLESDLPNITCSSVHLGKSLYNLVSNACEAMPKGGRVTIKTTSQYLEQPIQGYDEIRSGDYAVLSVSDTGEGIPANDLKRIFEPFYTKKVMGRSGTGLGLAVVWGTVKDHNGYINVQSEKGKGSTFILYFPVTREGITAEGVPASISEYMGKGESVLVVDDVKEQRELAAGMLRTLNYNVESVASGEEAVAYLKEHQADLTVLDMIMDLGMDGLDTYRSIIKIRPKQKAIIVSGFSESDRVHDAQGLGAGAYVRKPYVKEKLGVAVRKELDQLSDDV